MAPKILKATEVNIARAARIIKKGGLVIFPTDTVYGLGCGVFNRDAVRKIFLVKRREANKPLPVLIASRQQLGELTEAIPPLASELIKKYWPGRLTIVFYKNEKVPVEVTAGTNKIGIRMPAHRVAQQLIKMSDTPIIGTSANLSGEESLRSVKDIPKKLLEGVDLALDGGNLSEYFPSTIIDVTTRPPQVLRKGNVEVPDFSNEI